MGLVVTRAEIGAMEQATGEGVAPSTGAQAPPHSGDTMKRLMTILAATAAATALAGCEPPSYQDDTVEVSEVLLEEPVAEAVAAEDSAEPVVATDASAPPVDNSVLPADKRSSEESVQPESETLFF